MTKTIVSLAFVLTATAASAAGAKPVVLWASYPVGADEHVLLQGGHWGTSPAVEIGGRRIEPTVLSDNGLVFPFPAGGERILSGRVIGETGASEPFVLNAPTVWWMQGDDGDVSTPGGTLRLFGRSLAPAADRKGPVSSWSARVQPGVRVRLGDRLLPLVRTDVWSLDATVPDDVAPGTYAVAVANGLEGGAEWTEVGSWKVAPPRKIWKDDLFNVEDFGAGSQDGVDDWEAFDAALAAARKNGGGTVYVPCGRYRLSRPLEIPPHVLLKGEDRALSQIYWPDTLRPHVWLIHGEHSFGIHDLFISSGLYRHGIVAGCGYPTVWGALTHDVSLKRLRIKLISDDWRDENNLANFLPRYSTRGDGIRIPFCRRGEIEDCVLYCDKDAMRTLFFEFTGECIRMANCRINGTGWAVFGGDRCIYENNDANNCTYSIYGVCRRLFWSGNRQTDLFTNNREALTHDGSRTAWRSTATGVAEGTHVTLKLSPNAHVRTGTNFAAWVGFDLQIASGTGVGQTRTVTAMRSYEDVTIDRPFDIAPDETSVFVIGAERRGLLYLDNDTEDAGVAIQLYGGATDCVVGRNRCRRAGGIHGSGRNYGGLIPCWYVQFLGNVVEEGNSYRGTMGVHDSARGASLIGAFPPDVRPSMPLSQTYVYRDNEIWSNGSLMISVHNALVERNTVRRSEYGISSRRYQKTMFVSSNVFDRVAVPYLNMKGAKIVPPYVDRRRDEFLAQLKAGTFPKRSTANRHAFGFSFECQPGNDGLRAATVGRLRKPFNLPVSLSIGGVLTGDVRRVTVRLAPEGGWTFGGDVELERVGPSRFGGKVRVTPPPKGPVGMFTLNVHVEAAGEGWTHAEDLVTNPLAVNRFLVWETSLAPAGQAPTEWRRLEDGEGMDPNEKLFPEKVWGERLTGMDCRFRSTVRVVRETTFLFRRENRASEFLVDGRREIEIGAASNREMPVKLKPGDHVLELVLPAKGGAARDRKDGLALTCTFPYGCPPGSWGFLGR